MPSIQVNEKSGEFKKLTYRDSIKRRGDKIGIALGTHTPPYSSDTVLIFIQDGI